MFCYCKSLKIAGSCVRSPEVIACGLPTFYSLLEADGRPVVEFFY